MPNTRRTAKGRQQPSIADGRYFCRAPSVCWHSGLGRACCAECLFWTLGKIYFLFFSFLNQTFFGKLLHYVDQSLCRVFFRFWHSTKRSIPVVSALSRASFLVCIVTHRLRAWHTLFRALLHALLNCSACVVCSVLRVSCVRSTRSSRVLCTCRR